MEQGYSIKNLFNNASKGQIIGFTLGVVIVLLLFVVLISWLANSNMARTEETKPVEGTTTTETRVDEDGNTIITETKIDNDGNEIVTESKVDEYGNVTTVDPDLITTYFPYQVMREHEGWEATLRYSLHISDDGKTINALVESCDEEKDKELIQQYINSIPIDISEYTIEYETFSEDAICDYTVDLW